MSEQPTPPPNSDAEIEMEQPETRRPHPADDVVDLRQHIERLRLQERGRGPPPVGGSEVSDGGPETRRDPVRPSASPREQRGQHRRADFRDDSGRDCLVLLLSERPDLPASCTIRLEELDWQTGLYGIQCMEWTPGIHGPEIWSRDSCPFTRALARQYRRRGARRPRNIVDLSNRAPPRPYGPGDPRPCIWCVSQSGRCEFEPPCPI